MHQVLDIPVSWFNFITLMLLTPEKFDWRIFFLNSALWKILLDNGNESKEDTISFIIPDKCFVTQAPTCKLAELDNADELIDEGIPQTTPLAPKRKRRGKGPLVESEVRRSPRIVELNAGYKQHSSCSDRNCLSCSASPPVTKHKIVKKLASSFCKINEEKLEAKLKKSRKMDKEKEKDSGAGGSNQRKKPNNDH
jgi:hypothetical protein